MDERERLSFSDLEAIVDLFCASHHYARDPNAGGGQSTVYFAKLIEKTRSIYERVNGQCWTISSRADRLGGKASEAFDRIRGLEKSLGECVDEITMREGLLSSYRAVFEDLGIRRPDDG